jgi:hypothetical protein
MPPERRRLIVLLAILGIVAAIAVYRYWPGTAQTASTRSAARSGTRSSGPSSVTAPDVHLQALAEEKPKPAEAPQRDLFRFKPKPAPPPPAAPPSAPASADRTPAGPPPLAPIPMRFIGLLEATAQGRKIAVLSDGRGIYQGKEGDIIEGRYRILRIGVESLDIAYLDGRGRQTIRLSGS